jgi:Mitotic checkpoint protein
METAITGIIKDFYMSYLKIRLFVFLIFRITSMYADNENDELLFHLNANGTIDMLETDYSKMLSGFMNQYLHGSNGSLPAFTSALTLELVNRMTVTTVS